MRLKDILTYCLDIENNFTQKYYWVLNGVIYRIDKIETLSNPELFDNQYLFSYNQIEDSYTNFLHLSRYRGFAKDSDKVLDYTHDYITLNLDNQITIFNNYIIVHKTRFDKDEYHSELFRNNTYQVDENAVCNTQYYALGLIHRLDTAGCLITNLRTVFKDLIYPPIQPKTVEFTLDEKVDDLINELMKDNRQKAIKKLKRMLNNRL